MNTFVPRRCRECGVGRVRLLATPNRYSAYRTLPRVEVPADLELPTCDNCGTEWLDETYASRLDAALEEAYRSEMGTRVLAALNSIVSTMPQRDLERLVGLSPGYLSKLRSRDRVPRPDLVALLTLLANDVERINEVKQLWRDSAPQAPAVMTASGELGDVSRLIWTGQPNVATPAKSPTQATGPRRITTSRAA